MDRITFFAMSQRGLKTLESVIQKYGPKVIDMVITSKDPGVQYDYYEDIQALCAKSKIPVYDREEKSVVKARYMIAAAWRWMIKLEKGKQLIVLHDSLLPAYRGYSPLVSMLINGEKEIGVTAYLATKEYDRGDILLARSKKIKYPLKIKDALEIVSGCYEDTVLSVVDRIFSGKGLKGKPQNEKKATYSVWRDEEDYNINWSMKSEEIKRFIDALGFPYKGAACVVGREKIRILGAEVVRDVKIENRTPGKVFTIKGGDPVIICGRGLLKLTHMQDEKKNKFRLDYIKTRFR